MSTSVRGAGCYVMRVDDQKLFVWCFVLFVKTTVTRLLRENSKGRHFVIVKMAEAGELAVYKRNMSPETVSMGAVEEAAVEMVVLEERSRTVILFPYQSVVTHDCHSAVHMVAEAAEEAGRCEVAL